MASRSVGAELLAQDGVSLQHSAMSIFRSVSMIDVLGQDPPPAFVLDLHDYVNDLRQAEDAPLRPIFCNTAFREQTGLLEIVCGLYPCRLWSTLGQYLFIICIMGCSERWPRGTAWLQLR